MTIFYLLFIVPALVLSIRIVFILSPKLWRITKGDIISYDIVCKTYRSKFPSLQENFNAKYLRVKYKYILDDKTYVSNRISLDIMDKIYSDIELENDALLKSIYTNDIEVYYLKFYPRISILSMSFHKAKDHIVLIVALLLAMLISTLIIYHTH